MYESVDLWLIIDEYRRCSSHTCVISNYIDLHLTVVPEKPVQRNHAKPSYTGYDVFEKFQKIPT